MRFFAGLLFLGVVLGPFSLFSQQNTAGMSLATPTPRIEQALAAVGGAAEVVSVGAVELSPDGKRLAWVRGSGHRGARWRVAHQFLRVSCCDRPRGIGRG